MAVVFSPALVRAALVPTLVTLGAGALGGFALYAFNFPAAWMSGALVATTIVTLCGAPTLVPEPVRFVCFLLLGTSMGTALTPDMLTQASNWPISMGFLALSVAGVMGGVTLFLMRVAKWDLETSFYASAPGALAATLAMASASGADMRRVAFAQAIRLFLLVAVLTQVLGSVNAGPHGAAVVVSTPSSLVDLAILVLVGLACGLVAAWLRVPGGVMVGALFGSAALHASGLSDAHLPNILLIPCFVVLGSTVGIRFQGTTLATLRECLLASLGAFLVAITVSVVCAIAAAWATGEDVGKLVTAFAPGALETMTVLGFALGYDPAFMSAHHIFRFAGLSVALPLLAHLLFQSRRKL